VTLDIRPATVHDIRDIHRLLNDCARKGELLPRSLNELYEGVRDFFVAESDAGVVGCSALQVSWENLAEVKCLAVGESCRGQGVGRKLVERCLQSAAALGIDTIFCLTYQPEFFRKLGFEVVDRSRLPHKVWGECVHCPKFPDCDETAMVHWAAGPPDAADASTIGVPPLTPAVAPPAE